jgi:dinuclear metal center YbgI/SA1388 family protein
MTEAELVFTYLDELLGTSADVDYPGALNGLQVEGPRELARVAVAVDASEDAIRGAAAAEAQLLLVHHGLFWDPERRVTGRRFRKLQTLLAGGVALYSSHLPLDRHPEVGNGALLLRHLGLEPAQPFGYWKDLAVGWTAEAETSLDALVSRTRDVVQDEVRVVRGGPSTVTRVAVVTGAGASFLEEAAERGIHALVTGEAPHHAYQDARELGVNLILAGHYRTETLGVQAVARRLEEAFGLPWVFLDDPSGF